MKNIIYIVIAVTLMSQGIAKADIYDLLKAIRYVETGNAVDPPNGDNGASRGPLQIHQAFWTDAVNYDDSIGGSYSDCSDYGYSCKIAIAYFERYCPKALSNMNYQILARTFNGGWNGMHKKSTLKYWKRIEKALASE